MRLKRPSAAFSSTAAADSGKYDAVREANAVDGSWNHQEKDQQSHGDGDMHPEHALLCVVSVGHNAEEDEEDANPGRNQRGGMCAAGGDEADDAEQNEQDAEADRELCHVSGTPQDGAMTG